MRAFITVAACCLFATQGRADFVLWDPADGGNGHYYGLVMPAAGQNYTWMQARDAAAAMMFEGSVGHLVTITSAAENDFLGQHFASSLSDSIPQTTDRSYAWIGLYAPTPYSGFQWVTGEPVTYTNWAPGEPNFYGTPLWQYVHYWTRDFGSGPTWTWNNEQNQGYSQPGYTNTYGFIVEFDGPFTVTPEPASVVLLVTGAVVVGGWRRRRSRTARNKPRARRTSCVLF